MQGETTAQPGDGTEVCRFVFGSFVLDAGRGTLLRDGIELPLRPKSYDVLLHLVSRAGRLVSRQELFESVWPDVVVTDDSLTQCLIEIRRALGDDKHSIIRTMPRRGYLFEARVEVHGPGSGGEPPRPGHVNTGTRGALPSRRTASSLLLLAIALGGTWWWMSKTQDAAHQPDPASSNPGASIAVLPFDDMSSSGNHEYLADGIAEEILNLLVQVPGVTVIARTSSFSFKGQNLDATAIADRLNVTHLLEGSVRMEGNTVRITAQLLEGDGGAHVWSQRYERSLDHVFAVQDEIATAVVKALSVRLVGTQPRQQETGTEAYSLYLQARYFFNQATTEGRSMAIEKLNEALALDPGHSPAKAFLAEIYMYQSNNGERPFDSGFELARKTAQEALAIDASLTGAWGTLAYIQSYYDWDWKTAQGSIAKMLELGPETAYSLHVAAIHYNMIGKFERALSLRNKAIRLDPLSPYFRQSQAHTLISLGKFDAAQSAILELLEIYPDHPGAKTLLAKSLLLQGDAEEALQLLEAYRSNSKRVAILRAIALRRIGQQDEADNAVASLQADTAGGAAYSLAVYHSGIGELQPALNYLEDAVASRWRILAYILGEPLLYPLHDDPRWPIILDQLGLLEYWLEGKAETPTSSNTRKVGNSSLTSRKS